MICSWGRSIAGSNRSLQINDSKPRLQAWFATIPLDENQRVGITQWVTTLEALNVLGTFTCTQGSDLSLIHI